MSDSDSEMRYRLAAAAHDTAHLSAAVTAQAEHTVRRYGQQPRDHPATPSAQLLQNRVDHLTSQVEQLQRARSAQLRQRQQGTMRQSERTAINRELIKQLSTAQQALDLAKRERDDAIVQARRAETAHIKRQTSARVDQATHDEMCRRLVDLEAKAMQAQLEGENLRQALHDCEQLVVQLRTDIHTLTQSREQLEAMYQEKCVRAADLEDLLRDRHAAETAAKNELSETRSELESERAARRAAEAAMVRMQTDHAAAIARLRAPTENPQQTKTIQDLRASMERLEQDAAHLKAVAARAEEQRDAMSQDMAATTAATEQTMSELLHELAEKDAALVELTQQLHARHHQPRTGMPAFSAEVDHHSATQHPRRHRTPGAQGRERAHRPAHVPDSAARSSPAINIRHASASGVSDDEEANSSFSDDSDATHHAHPRPARHLGSAAHSQHATPAAAYGPLSDSESDALPPASSPNTGNRRTSKSLRRQGSRASGSDYQVTMSRPRQTALSPLTRAESLLAKYGTPGLAPIHAAADGTTVMRAHMAPPTQLAMPSFDDELHAILSESQGRLHKYHKCYGSEYCSANDSGITLDPSSPVTTTGSSHSLVPQGVSPARVAAERLLRACQQRSSTVTTKRLVM